jgi:hypothetical protein
MNNKNVILAKKELIQFLKKNNAVATYFWTIYGHERNTKSVIYTLAKIGCETRPKQLCILYEDLIGKTCSNPSIKDKVYWSNDTLYHVYQDWCKYLRNKFHVR